MSDLVLQVGKRYRIKTRPVIGMDGVTYNVLKYTTGGGPNSHQFVAYRDALELDFIVTGIGDPIRLVSVCLVDQPEVPVTPYYPKTGKYGKTVHIFAQVWTSKMQLADENFVGQSLWDAIEDGDLNMDGTYPRSDEVKCRLDFHGMHEYNEADLHAFQQACPGLADHYLPGCNTILYITKTDLKELVTEVRDMYDED